MPHLMQPATRRLPSILATSQRPSTAAVLRTNTSLSPAPTSSFSSNSNNNPLLLPLRPLRPPSLLPPHSSSSSSSSSRSASSASTRWKARQSTDAYTRSAKLAGLKSRAAYKLLEIDARHRLFRGGATVVDLGYAPGSWSQVAVARVRPAGRVVGIDVIPAQPPRGASALQGDFLRADTRARLREFLRDPARGRVRDEGERVAGGGEALGVLQRVQESGEGLTGGDGGVGGEGEGGGGGGGGGEGKEGGGALGVDAARLEDADRVVDVVLSDMSAPWPLASQTWVKSVSNPYLRMMNTSGMAFRDHAGSMDLCLAALDFCYHTLVNGGHFLCKFYAGSEDHALELRLKRLFDKVHRIKPDSSRKESKEAYFVALRRKPDVPKEIVFADT